MAAPKKQIEKKVCTDCKKEQALNDYYNSRSFLHSDGKLHVCKDCVKNNVDGNKNRFIEFLASINYPLIQAIFDKTGVDIPKYYQLICGNQYKNMFFSDSDSEVVIIPKVNEIINKDSDEITTEDKLEWGNNFNDEEIKQLKYKYSKLIAEYEHKTIAQKMILKNIAMAEIESLKAKSIDGLKKASETIVSLMTAGGIKPIQESANSEELSYGVWIKKLENEKPVSEVDENLKDVDKIQTYITKWFLGHFKEMMGFDKK